MATVRRVPKSPYWIAKYRDGDVIKFRTTKQKSRSKALEMALGWERLAKLANEGELTKARSLDFVNELLERVGQGPVQKQSTKEFAKEWIERGLKTATTRKRYDAVINGFLKFLGEKRAKASIGSITAEEIERFRDLEAERKSASTADFSHKVIRAMMEKAKRTNQRSDNPADAINKLGVEQQRRKAFTVEQLSQLYSAASTEWKGMILLGAYAGIRLNDAANLRWEQFDLSKQTVTFLPSKTALRKREAVELALHPVIVNYLKALPKPAKIKAAIFESLAGRASGSAGGLSNQFAALLSTTGLRPEMKPDEGAKDPSSRKRSFNELGFHSTRHFFITRMANADVPLDVRKALSGHSTDSAHARYVSLELDTQKRAIAKLPMVELAGLSPS
ncbi:site-specific recombinase XerD [Roseimicrobium gellanilyticum]|uniref:Site-specific recombinase XerD n=1 Tax=Roseimicrobium gellanilyticum TaxID=748857 RepID=A0A366HQU0_9BACT|nr:tyrosine-type recombinase/integrase [Roseimicrobium gellanilyticum]RBP45219.1 site-specific recombinase XerD [Roseimicrobium gellanilyticum]